MSKQQAALIQSLSARAYVDPEILKAEQNLIFASTWQYACHVEKLGQPGDYMVCEIATESIILIRENDTTINAFYNVCPHRASRLLEAEGCKKRFACPYHAWTFNTRGELISAPNAQNVAGFELSNYRLKACRVELVHGLVFVNLDDAATSLKQLAPEMLVDLEAYAPNLPALTFVHRTEALLDCNWKVAIENYSECYHCELIHKELTRGVLDMSSYSIQNFAQSQKHLSGSQSGEKRVYEFDDASATDFVAWWLWPNFSFQSYPGGRMHCWKWTPLAVDRTHLTVDWYFPSPELAAWEREMIRHHAATTFSEDSSVMALVQQGLSSRAYESGPLMIDAEKSQYSEHAVAAIQQLWRDAMGADYE